MRDIDILLNFGKKVQELRLLNNFSQEKLAEISELDRTYISSVERGKRNISLINIVKISKALDVAPGFLFENHGG